MPTLPVLVAVLTPKKEMRAVLTCAPLPFAFRLAFNGDMGRGVDDAGGLASLDPVVVRRFLSLDAVRPKRPR